MKKLKTLKMNYEFKNVFLKGNYFVNKQIITYIMKNNIGYNRIGIAISSKSCHAVKRNHIKRLVRAAYKDYEKELDVSYDIVFVWNKKCNVEEASYYIIKENLEKAFLKAGILK